MSDVLTSNERLTDRDLRELIRAYEAQINPTPLFADAVKACLRELQERRGHETAAPQSKFDLAFEIMRQLETERMDTMQSCHFGYVLRVERETKAPLVRGHLEGCTCSLCKRIPLFREHPDAL